MPAMARYVQRRQNQYLFLIYFSCLQRIYYRKTCRQCIHSLVQAHLFLMSSMGQHASSVDSKSHGQEIHINRIRHSSVLHINANAVSGDINCFFFHAVSVSVVDAKNEMKSINN